jgi:hypothetical protein
VVDENHEGGRAQQGESSEEKQWRGVTSAARLRRGVRAWARRLGVGAGAGTTARWGRGREHGDAAVVVVRMQARGGACGDGGVAARRIGERDGGG